MTSSSSRTKRIMSPLVLALCVPLLAACDQPEDDTAPPAGGMDQQGAVPGDAPPPGQPNQGFGGRTQEPGQQ